MSATTSTVGNPLMGILQMLRDPSGANDRLRELADAEAALLTSQKRIETEIADARRSLAEIKYSSDAREAALAKRESEVRKVEEEQRVAFAAFNKERRDFEEVKARSLANLKRREAESGTVQTNSPRLRSVMPG
jgi:hypothetical protein